MTAARAETRNTTDSKRFTPLPACPLSVRFAPPSKPLAFHRPSVGHNVIHIDMQTFRPLFVKFFTERQTQLARIPAGVDDRERILCDAMPHTARAAQEAAASIRVYRSVLNK